MNDSVWFKTLENKVLEQSDLIYRKDFKFYDVESFIKLSKKIDEFSANCKACSELKSDAVYIADNLGHLLKGDMASRKEYEKRISLISRHVKGEHKVYPVNYFISFFSFLGLLFGILAGMAIMWLVNRNLIKEGFLVGSVIGLVIGRIAGKLKDKQLAREGRILK